jgi:Winged helix DNA-binding domain
MTKTEPGAVLGRRALNRAYLARQLLLERSPMSALDAVEHLAGLQAQAPDPPYIGLWSRLADFRFEELAGALLDRRAVRITLMRGTVHLVGARDCLDLRPLVQPLLLRRIDGSPYGKALTGVDRAELVALGRELLAQGPCVFSELGPLLQRGWPERDARALAQVLRTELPMVHVPPRGVWGRSGRTAHSTVEEWLGEPVGTSRDRAWMLRRYLAAFGPATVADVAAWSGLTGWRPVVEDARPQLVSYRDERGRELFDLPGAPLPDPAVAAPVRLVAEYDNLLLSHADRARVVDDADRPRLMTANGIVPGTLLVDGFVRGTWRLEKARGRSSVTVTPWIRLTRADRAAAEAEAAALLAAAAPDAVHEVRTADPEG